VHGAVRFDDGVVGGASRQVTALDDDGGPQVGGETPALVQCLVEVTRRRGAGEDRELREVRGDDVGEPAEVA
jgi:hypothetical protein